MKIAYVYDAVYPWETGGIQKRVWELARRLADDHEVHWYGLRYWNGPETIEREGVVLHGISDPPDLYVNGRRSIQEALQFSVKLIRPLLREEFDVIDCQEFPYFPSFPSKLHTVTRDARLCLTWHEVWTDYWYEYLGWKGVCGKMIERLMTLLPDVHVAVSDRTSRDLSSLGVANTTLVPNGISFDEIRPVPPAGQPIDVLFVGRLIEEKNPALVVQAIAELRDERPNINCIIVGSGPERSTLNHLVSRLNLETNVQFVGTLEDYEDVLGLMKSAKVFALPSRREGFGISVLEALACGTPVVTLAHPRNAAADLVDHGHTGALCAATPKAVAEGIRIADTATMEADCIATAQSFTWSRISKRMETVYREIVNA